ncbi:hypothetical protein [Acinetobacter courvalinii]|uniref:Uncharacterized protein n=1 Tax=Acinetobacter courvalinii TaxID=280147 RepID=N9PQF6_9GAMM|nr:hypothetical protein [Acinetobacter courvalinii]ENX35799.1 hypothetical protein F888_03632 [Acinetobacter courvalinii]KAB0655950.1 hypothetical protein F7P77_18320 [Acinetobacter courvalinii]GGH39116.1 hypothetical protein GCM10007354_24680 [Acinetobacter courvalinii]
MNIVQTLKALGGMTGLKAAMHKQAMTDYFCPENGKWYIEGYWFHNPETSTLRGYSLQEILSKTPMDTTHCNGSFLCKIDMLDRVCIWKPEIGKWVCEGWLPKDELEPLD